MYGSKGMAEVVPVAVPLVVVPALGPGAPLTLGPGPDIVNVQGENQEEKENPMNQKRSRSADSEEDWLDDGGT